MPKHLLDFEDFKKAVKKFEKEVNNCKKVLNTSINTNDIFHAWKKVADSYWKMDEAARDVKDAMREKVLQSISIVDA